MPSLISVISTSIGDSIIGVVSSPNQFIVMILIIAAIGTARNIPKIPKYAPPIVIEIMMIIGFKFNAPAIIRGPMTLPSIC